MNAINPIRYDVNTRVRGALAFGALLTITALVGAILLSVHGNPYSSLADHNFEYLTFAADGAALIAAATAFYAARTRTPIKEFMRGLSREQLHQLRTQCDSSQSEYIMLGNHHIEKKQLSKGELSNIKNCASELFLEDVKQTMNTLSLKELKSLVNGISTQIATHMLTATEADRIFTYAMELIPHKIEHHQSAHKLLSQASSSAPPEFSDEQIMALNELLTLNIENKNILSYLTKYASELKLDFKQILQNLIKILDNPCTFGGHIVGVRVWQQRHRKTIEVLLQEAQARALLGLA